MIDLCGLRDLINDINLIEKKMKERFGVTIRETTVLCAIDKGIGNPSKMAKQMGLSPSRLSRLLSAIEDKSLVIRVLSSEDRRLYFFKTSAEGKKVIEEIKSWKEEIPPAVIVALDYWREQNGQ